MSSSSSHRSRGTRPPIYGPPASSTPYHGTEAGPTRSPCDQCHSDTIVQYERTKARPRVPDIIPIRGSAAQLNNGPCAVIFDSKLPGPGGVLVSDILAFRDVLPYPGAPALRHAPGYLDCVVLSVLATPGFGSRTSSSDSMDQKLHMPEILDMIFDHIDQDFTIRRLKTWAYLARTCRTFQNPALNALWGDQTSLVPALSCFPDDLWERATDSKTFLGVRRPLTAADWERPMFYWNRIRSLGIGSLDTRKISPDVCELLRLSCPTEHLFPNLQHLGCLDDQPANFPVSAMFFSPRLTSIRLAAGASRTQLSVLPALGVKHPGLTDVDLRGRGRSHCDKPLLQSILAFISNLSRLESFGINNVDPAILEHVARLPALTSLVIDVFMSLEAFSQLDGSDPRFPLLEELHLWGTTPDVGTAMVEAIEHHGLMALSLVFEAEYPTSGTTARLYNAVAANGSYATLDWLRVEDEWIYKRKHTVVPAEEAFDSYIVRAGTLRTLFPFTNVTTVILKPFYGFDVDDDVVSELARAWCRLEELRLACSYDLHIPGFQPRMTLGAVRAIATHCKNLHTLELYLDGRKLPSPADACIQTTLTRLEVQCSPISAPTAVAAFLSGIFPQLTDVNSYCVQRDPPPRSVGRWEKVARLLGSTVPGRGEESTEDEWSDSDDEDV
ncbi:hypothetical protein DFH06DRAFT_1485918 [Mycena polygramma]|nr:hypothetical protein DFH06DRAFT_1485918 [Mycena polygramma]